jgi:hypothetical protein
LDAGNPPSGDGGDIAASAITAIQATTELDPPMAVQPGGLSE